MFPKQNTIPHLTSFKHTSHLLIILTFVLNFMEFPSTVLELRGYYSLTDTFQHKRG